MEWTSAFPVFTPTTKQLLALSQWSGANNNIGLDTSLDWKSDLSGKWLRGMQQYYRQLDNLNQALPNNPIAALSVGMTQQWMQNLLFDP
ncbi:MAG: hypothetical protein KBT54_01940, partial [Amphritea sp.]|nr:hypothetical protein [Amphritea sp.]